MIPDIESFIRQNYLTMTDQEISDELGEEVTYRMVKGRRQKMGLLKSSSTTNAKQGSSVSEKGSAILGLLEKRGIPPEEISIDKLRISDRTFTNEDTGTTTKTSTESLVISLAPDWADGPDWPVVQQAKPTVIKPLNRKPKKSGLKVSDLLPDPQIGFRLLMDGTLDPFHDVKAMDIALQVIEETNPDLIVNLGDTLDFAEFTVKFIQEPGFARTTQATIDAAHEFFARQRAAAPHAKIVVLEGNHDRRLSEHILRNAKAAFGLKRAHEPESWPVLSVPHLLRFEELNVEYLEGYPAAEYYINDRLKCVHGRRYGKRGTVAKSVIDDERVSTIQGHTHRIETVYKTTHTRTGPRFNMAATLGCLCRIDGAVPSTRSSFDSNGKHIEAYEDWQQAMAVVEYEEGDSPFSITPIFIHDNQAIYNGKLYTA